MQINMNDDEEEEKEEKDYTGVMGGKEDGKVVATFETSFIKIFSYYLSFYFSAFHRGYVHT